MNKRQQSSSLLLICGLIGMIGCVSVLLTDFIGIVAVNGYNPISQTISALAITEKAWIQDTGLNLFAAAFAACAIGLFSMNIGSWKWQTIVWAFLSPIFFVIPNGWDGAYERFISLIMVTWVALISWLLFQKGLGKRLISPFPGIE